MLSIRAQRVEWGEIEFELSVKKLSKGKGEYRLLVCFVICVKLGDTLNKDLEEEKGLLTAITRFWQLSDFWEASSLDPSFCLWKDDEASAYILAKLCHWTLASSQSLKPFSFKYESKWPQPSTSVFQDAHHTPVLIPTHSWREEGCFCITQWPSTFPENRNMYFFFFF